MLSSRFRPVISKFSIVLAILWLSTTAAVIAQSSWEQSNGPYGAYIHALAINPATQDIFAATENGVYRSANNGESWETVYTSSENIFIWSLAIDPDRQIIFIGTLRYGILRSTQTAGNWTAVNAGLTNTDVQALAFNPTTRVIFAGTRGGVFRSTNHGDSWIAASTGLAVTDVWSLTIHPITQDVFAGTSRGLFHSTNNGDSWVAANVGLPEVTVTALTIHANGDIWAGTSNGVFRSTNNGDSWTMVNSGLTNTNIRSLAIHPSGDIFVGTDHFYSGAYYGGVFRSTDNGNGWTVVNTGLTNTDAWSLIINANGDIFAGTSGGVFRSLNNGDSWTAASTGLREISVSALAIHPATQNIFAGTSAGGVFRSTDSGSTWTPVNNGLSNSSVVSLAINPATQSIFAGTSAGVFRSTNNGNSWAAANAGLPNITTSALAINASGDIFAGTFNGGVFRSTNNGESWTAVNNGLAHTDVRSLAIDPATRNIFAGTLGGGVFRSTINGDKWTPVNEGLIYRSVRCLAINPATRDIFVGTDVGVFRSTNGGNSWAAADNGLMSRRILALAINASGYIFAATESNGIFRSRNNGDSWTSTSIGLMNVSVQSLAIHPATGEVLAGTTGSSVFRNDSLLFPIVMHTPAPTQPMSQEILIEANIIDNTGALDATFHYRQGGDSTFSPPLPLIGAGDDYRGLIPAHAVTSRGIEYYFVVKDALGETVRVPLSGIFSIPVRVNGEGEARRNAQGSFVPQLNGNEQTAYRLFSTPLSLDDQTPRAVLEDDLGPYDIKKWRFYELPSDNSVYLEFPNTSALSPGRAFWLIVKEPGKIIDTGAGVSIKTDREYAMPLHPQWNFIGNPFSFRIPLKNIRFKSGQKIELRSFTAAWNDPFDVRVEGIEPFEGYAVHNDSSVIDTLFINPDFSSSLGPLTMELTSPTEKYSMQAASWFISIQARCQKARDLDNVAAVVSETSSNWDEMDQPEPPVIGEYVSVCFPHRDWASLAKTYCVDVRPEPNAGEVWELEVKTNIRDKIDLSFDGLESVPDKFEIWLKDEVLSVVQNLRESNHYAVAGTAHPKRLKLVAGKRAFIEGKLAGIQLVPTTYGLSQNFPNPFNPATTIQYQLPKAERVQLKVHNLLGEEVATLVRDQQKSAGYHATIWDGRNKNGDFAASGIYIFWMRAGSFTMARKMTLVK